MVIGLAGVAEYDKFWTNDKKCTLHINEDQQSSYWKVINS